MSAFGRKEVTNCFAFFDGDALDSLTHHRAALLWSPEPMTLTNRKTVKQGDQAMLALQGRWPAGAVAGGVPR